jgi:hypothetical protein
LPVSGTSCGLLAALSLIVRVPVIVPTMVGLNFTEILQCFKCITGEVQALVAENPAVMEILETLSATVPLLIRLTVLAAAVVPTACPAQLKLAGSTLAIAAGVAVGVAVAVDVLVALAVAVIVAVAVAVLVAVAVAVLVAVGVGVLVPLAVAVLVAVAVAVGVLVAVAVLVTVEVAVAVLVAVAVAVREAVAVAVAVLVVVAVGVLVAEVVAVAVAVLVAVGVGEADDAPPKAITLAEYAGKLKVKFVDRPVTGVVAMSAEPVPVSAALSCGMP